MEHKTKIDKHGSKYGFYSVSILRKKGWIFDRWERLEEFLDSPSTGCWCPLLLKYTEAKQFALMAKDENFVQEFKEKQKRKHANWLLKQVDRTEELYPVESEVF